MTSKRKEKVKWLTALLLCVSCLIFCVSMMAPTLAEEPATPYTLTVAGGTGGSSSYAAGTEVTITATVPAGQKFVSWNISPAVTYTSGTTAASAIAKFTMPAGAVTATAVFEPLTYALTVTGGTGGSSSYAAGAEATVTATVPAGQKFVRWDTTPAVTYTSGTTAASTAAKFTMPAGAVSATAVFEPITAGYALTVTGGTGGSASYAAGAEATITATPPTGQKFVRWDTNPAVTYTSGTSATSAIAKFTMPAGAVSAAAVFESTTTTTTTTTTALAGDNKFDPVSGMKYVYEVKTASDVSYSPKRYIYSSASFPAQAYMVPVLIKDSAYYIAMGGGTETLYYPLRSDGTLDTSKAYKAAAGKIFGSADDILVQGDPAGTKKYGNVDDKNNLFEALTDAGVSQDPKKFVYSSTAEPQKALPISAYLKNYVYYVQLLDDTYIALAGTERTMDCNNVISAGADKIFGSADDKVLFPQVSSGTSYRAVDGYKNLFETLVNGQPKSPKEFAYSTKTSPAQDTSVKPAYAKDSKYYTELTDYVTVYLAVKTDGTLNEEDAVWAGEDKIFGNADDKKAVKKEDTNYYYETSAGGLQMIEKKGSTPAPTDATTTNPFYNTEPGKDGIPNTGERARIGLNISLALIFAGMVYFGYRFFRREKEYC